MTTRAARAFARLATTADLLDRRHARRSSFALTPGHPGALPAAWAVVRLSVVGAAVPLLAPLVGSLAIRNTAAVRALIDRYPELLAQVMAGEEHGYPADRVRRTPAAARYFVASDLHRCVPGTIDWPTHQNARGLYELALDHYAAQDWHLVENGDVEDYWLVGGSTYGVVYDLFRLAGHALGPRRGAPLLRAVYREHLRRIVANNAGTYARIEEGFHRQGRYHRLVGNHDDVYLDEAMVAALGEVHEGIDVVDFLVFDADGDLDAGRDADRDAELDSPAGAGAGARAGEAVGIATHGHHVDGWNAPWRSGLGKLGTWLGSALLDAPLVANPGMPAPSETDALLGGHLPDVLTRVNRWLGANLDLYSVDEVLLFDSFRAHAGVPVGAAVEGGPLLLLGHTHLPLSRPLEPATRAAWERYYNSGAGIYWECVTGLEWDGTADPRHPEVRLVAWRYADRDEQTDPASVVGWDGDRAVVREVLDRVDPADTLAVVASGPAPSRLFAGTARTPATPASPSSTAEEAP